MRYLILAILLTGCADVKTPSRDLAPPTTHVPETDFGNILTAQPVSTRQPQQNATPHRDYRDWIWYDTGEPSASQAEMERKLSQDGKGGYWRLPSRGTNPQ